MRIVKDAKERRNEILDAAEELFGQKGFDKTSTNDILDKVKIARGTLYYHFKSKEEIMDALIERYNDLLLSAAKMAAEDKQLSINERIARVVMSLNMNEGNGREIIEHIHKPQNALMHQKIQRVIINGVPEILTGIILEGIDKGEFNTPYPYECMEMLVIYLNTLLDQDMIELNETDRKKRLKAFFFHVERLLGVEQGSLKSIVQLFEHK
ncbi:TetR/AcrR family transcriptional regulator [Lachnotalea glycerini]|uniref:TetR/AcrR family transcriptional regulator n=1 Tax=Lachnotalea glycerini TaxID=1763509 RepID=A0A371JHA4_9FIRM|nr:TetR/AcrR family transcriptional regulator [Lachnotalea glycerini]RDY32086.1 TetR/AcrR family transcriptional regulator [Lachnotalea glycerini]